MMYQTKMILTTLVLSVLVIGTLSLGAQVNKNIAAQPSNSTSSNIGGADLPVPSTGLGHTKDYLFGYKIGKNDAKIGIFGVDDSCDGHVYKNCAAGYADGYKSVCGDYKNHPNGCPTTSNTTSNTTATGNTSSGLTHTPDYLYGYKIGQKDGRQSGVFDVGDSCNGHVFKNCFAGYSDGFKSVCGDTKTHPKPCK